jgi:membrane protease YdiL (CAAX protease family)
MQGLIGRAIPGLWPALIIASILFGLSHMNNATPIAPDWRYVALATLAGIAYGMAYLRTGNIAAPTLTHFLVDVTWRGFFAG